MADMFTDEISKAINHLCLNPKHATTVVDKLHAQRIMLSTSGQLMACGSLWEIVLKDLGADIFRVSLKLWESPT